MNRESTIAPFEEVTCATMSPVEPTRVSKEQVVRHLRERHIRDLDGHVNVVGHPAGRMDAMAETLNAITQEALKGNPVGSIQEDALTTIAASYEMRNRTRVVLSRLPSHTQ